MVAFVVPEHQLGTAYGLYVPVMAILISHIFYSKKKRHTVLSVVIYPRHLVLISMQSIQNLGLALIAMAAGAILDTKGYLILEVFFCTCICSEYFLSGCVLCL